MKIKNHLGFDSQFPEKFNWGMCDSPKLSLLACQFAGQIQMECADKPENRHCVAGLRFALNKIAEIGEI